MGTFCTSSQFSCKSKTVLKNGLLKKSKMTSGPTGRLLDLNEVKNEKPWNSAMSIRT